MSIDASLRFSDRVANYTRYRPSYPPEAIARLTTESGLNDSPARGGSSGRAFRPGATVADIGSGTGLFTELLLPLAATTYAVEPNDAMRAESDRRLGERAGYTGVAGTAERTTLADRSVDLVTAAQAFHWFDPVPTKVEFERILRPRGRVALIWNRRDHAGSPFLERYERLLRTMIPEYGQVTHERASDDVVRAFLGTGSRTWAFPYHQRFDVDGLRGRLLSSSYAPQPGHPEHAPLVDGLHALFEEFAVDGEVTFAYRTELYVSAPFSGA